MAFSFENVAAASPTFTNSPTATTGASMRMGEQLQEITTDELGFSAINGEAQVRLLPNAWPSDRPPSSSCSLMSIASSRGLIAAAGPDRLVITTGDKVRAAFSAGTSGTEKIRTLEPQVTISQGKLAQVAFSSDEHVLVVSKLEDGGLLAYQVNSIEKGPSDPGLIISTNGWPLRALVPNPAPDFAELFAAVTTSGDLLMADFKAGKLREGPSGISLKQGVTAVSWSNRGKQLVVGLSDGTAAQMKPDGTTVAEIPKPNLQEPESHIASLTWLENDAFFIVYTPDTTDDGIPISQFFVVNRESKTNNFTFQELPEIVAGFGLDRLPTTFFITRLRNFPPHIQDALIVTASTTTDISMITKASKSLSADVDAVGTFTYTTVGQDSRRAQLPLSGSNDTSPIGMGLDLSSTQDVINPIPSDPEIEHTSGPAPCLFVLNNEGVLVAWWIIYDDSVRQKTLYSGFGQKQLAGTSKTAAQPDEMKATPKNGTSLLQPSPSPSVFAKPTLSAFPSSTSHQSLFGGAPSSSLGTTSTIGGSSWTSTGFGNSSTAQNSSGFGQPAFGAPSLPGSNTTSSIGSVGTLGARAPAQFGSTQTTTMSNIPAPNKPTNAFGTAGTSSQMPFGSAGVSSGESPFGTTAPKQQTGFGGAAPTSESPFTKASASQGFSGFGAAMKPEQGQSIFTQASGDSAFSKPASSNGLGAGSGYSFASGSKQTGSSFSGSSFQLQSSFRGDGTAKDDLPKPKEVSSFGFGSSFANTLGDSKTPMSPTKDKETEMDDDESGGESDSETEKEQSQRFTFGNAPKPSESKQPMITPPSTLSHPKTTPAPTVASLFGPKVESTTPAGPPASSSAWSFNNLNSTTPKDPPAFTQPSLFGSKTALGTTPAAVEKSQPVNVFAAAPALPKQTKESSKVQPTLQIREEPPSDAEVAEGDIPEAPLPPDPTSKPSYISGDTSASSMTSKAEQDDARALSDFLPANQSASKEEAHPQLPSEDEEEEDDMSSGFEGSGADITQDLSPGEDTTEEIDDATQEVENQTQEVHTSPESSFNQGANDSLETSPTGGLFTKVSTTTNNNSMSRQLFGEIGKAPIFVPPKPHESPRSPSPVRNLMSMDHLRPDTSRSVSAPPPRSSAIQQRKEDFAKSALAAQAAKTREEEARRERERQAEIARRKAEIEAQQMEELADDEDERIQRELSEPVQPKEVLDEFITYQPSSNEDNQKTGIPAQVERLYQDINSKIITLGINARSLQAFMAYQHNQEANDSWPGTLKSETPMDALNDEWVLVDIQRLHEGHAVLNTALDETDVKGYPQVMQSCYELLNKDLFELRTKVTALRKSIYAKPHPDSYLTSPLSAEQASIQHDLRKASAAVQTKLVAAEDGIAVLRAKIAELTPSSVNASAGFANGHNRRQSLLYGREKGGTASAAKKPTVEAVTSTIAKMTSMAEKKSADIDVLEAQLRKLDATLGGSLTASASASNAFAALDGRRSTSSRPGTPGSRAGSGAGSAFHTPDSRFDGTSGDISTGRRSSRGSRGGKGQGMTILTEDRERFVAKAKKKKETADVLKQVLAERRARLKETA